MINIKSIHKRFGGKIINADTADLSLVVKMPNINRLGMELNNHFFHKQILSVVFWGKTESKFFDLLTEKELDNRLATILQKQPPVFILNNHFQHQNTLKKAVHNYSEGRVPIIQMTYTSSEIACMLGTWLSKKISKWETIHGVAMEIFGEGVLITGRENVGKSEMALELLKMNHSFIADDSVDISRFGNTIIAKANQISKNFIHIRGVGILNVRELFGSKSIIEESNIGIVIELHNFDDTSVELLGDKQHYKELLGIKIPYYRIPTSSNRKISEIIETAVGDMKLKKEGYNSSKKFNERLKKLLSA